MSGMSSMHLTGAACAPETRRVDAALRVMFLGWHWSVEQLPGVCVGDLVKCAPLRQGDALYVQDESELLPGIWASRLEPVHSCPRMCPRFCTPGNWGIETTSNAPGHECSFPGVGVLHTRRTQSATSPSGSTHSRIGGTTSWAPGADSKPTGAALAPAPGLLPVSRSLGTDRPRGSSDSSIGGEL